MDGLIIQKKWLNLICSGRKSLEIRGSLTHKTGERILLLEPVTCLIVAECTIQSSYQMTESLYIEQKEQHCINTEYSSLPYKNPCGWQLSNICCFEHPIHYIHPTGAVIWIKDVENRTNRKKLGKKLPIKEFLKEREKRLLQSMKECAINGISLFKFGREVSLFIVNTTWNLASSRFVLYKLIHKYFINTFEVKQETEKPLMLEYKTKLIETTGSKYGR
jgi:hypothetical protein